jgi:RNA polymerase subunit RPABC4/transcription elongation factor Spt4
LGEKTGKVCAAFGILFFIGGGIAFISGTIGGATVCGIIGFIFIMIGVREINKETAKINKQIAQFRNPIPTNPIPVSGVTCSNCGNVTGTFNKFCPNCGFGLTRLEGVAKTIPASGIRCSNCDNETDSMNSFCPHCGIRLTR